MYAVDYLAKKDRFLFFRGRLLLFKEDQPITKGKEVTPLHHDIVRMLALSSLLDDNYHLS